MSRTNKSVPLGSGRVYMVEHNGTMLTAAQIVAACIDDNLLGETKGGATLAYTATKHSEKDDFGVLERVVLTEEDVKLKLGGLFSWAPGTLEKLIATARHETEGDYTVYKIGGIENDNGKSYVVIFKHIDKVLGDMYFAIVGTNDNGLELAFVPDATTKPAPEFTARPHDGQGTLLKYFETAPASAAATPAAGGSGSGSGSGGSGSGSGSGSGGSGSSGSGT